MRTSEKTSPLGRWMNKESIRIIDQSKEIVRVMGAITRLKTEFGLQHLLAAALFARKALEIESAHDEIVVSGEPYFSHRAYVTGSVLSAVASLEATINELFIAAQHGDPNTFKGADPEFAVLLAEVWEVIEGIPALAKYQTALILARKPQLDRGASRYREAAILIQLRNALVHYKPEWDTDQREHRKIERRLKDRFALNPFTIPSDAFFPKKCLGHGCAEWAVKSSMSFMNEFLGRLELPMIPNEERQDREEILELLRTR
jgi:hypothetical protein